MRDDAGASVPEDRRGHILRVSAELFMKQGIVQTSMRQIGSAVGILGASLYHHFTSKDELVILIMLEPTESLTEAYTQIVASDASAVTKLERMIEASFDSMRRYPYPTNLYINNIGYFLSRPALQQIVVAASVHRSMWIGVIDEGVRTGEFRSDVNPTLFATIAQTVIWGTPHPSRERSRKAFDELARETTTFLVRGVSESSRRGKRGS